MNECKRNFVRAVLGAALAVGLFAPGTPAADYYFGVDIPADLFPSDVTTNQIVKTPDVQYGEHLLLVGLDPAIDVSAFHANTDGSWMIVPDSPVTPDSTTFEPRDVVGFDGSDYSMYFDGSAAGVPEGARIDALFLDANANPVISFDIPVQLDGSWYERSDLILFDGAFTPFWNGSSAGVPAIANLVGAVEETSGDLLLAFDLPLDLDGTLHERGDIVRWDGAFSQAYSPPPNGWPVDVQFRDVGLEAWAPGETPDGRNGTTPLTMDRDGTEITLSWGASCSDGPDAYRVVEGLLGSFYGHYGIEQTFQTSAQITDVEPQIDKYYLIVATRDGRDGSYGRDSEGNERPPEPGRDQAFGVCLTEEAP